MMTPRNSLVAGFVTLGILGVAVTAGGRDRPNEVPLCLSRTTMTRDGCQEKRSEAIPLPKQRPEEIKAAAEQRAEQREREFNTAIKNGWVSINWYCHRIPDLNAEQVQRCQEFDSVLENERIQRKKQEEVQRFLERFTLLGFSVGMVVALFVSRKKIGWALYSLFVGFLTLRIRCRRFFDNAIKHAEDRADRS